MRKIACIALASAAGIALASLLVLCIGAMRYAGTSKLAPNLGVAFFYNFLMISMYGWILYLPFAALHAYLLRRSSKITWLTSTIIGGLLSGLIVVLLTSSFTPSQIELGQIFDSQLTTTLVYGGGGSLYGLLYYRWIATKMQ